MERPSKRQRLSKGHVTTLLEVKKAENETALEVDILILDYLAQKTIQSCMDSRGAGSQAQKARTRLEHNVLMSDDFIALFKTRHDNYTADRELRFRVLLLQFTTLFTQRLSSNCTSPSPASLKPWRRRNNERARHWLEACSTQPSESFNSTSYKCTEPACPPEILHRNRAHVLEQLGISAESTSEPFYGTELSTSLLDLLPLFMQLSTLITNILDQSLNEHWMLLASEFMLQACLEQYLIYGASGIDTIDEAFAWGPLPPTPAVLNTPRAGQIPLPSSPLNNDEDINLKLGSQVEQWEKAKGECLVALSPSPSTAQGGQDLVGTLLEVAQGCPIRDFEDGVLNFIKTISELIPPPVLLQLEKGKLDGMTEKETQTFLTEVCGLSDSEQNLGWKEFTGLPALSTE